MNKPILFFVICIVISVVSIPGIAKDIPQFNENPLLDVQRQLYLNHLDSLISSSMAASQFYAKSEDWETYLECIALYVRAGIVKDHYRIPEQIYINALKISGVHELDRSIPMSTIYEGFGNHWLEESQTDSAKKYMTLAAEIKETNFRKNSQEMAELFISWSKYYYEILDLKVGIEHLEYAEMILYDLLDERKDLKNEEEFYLKWLLAHTYHKKAKFAVQLGQNDLSRIYLNESKKIRKLLPEVDSLEIGEGLALSAIYRDNIGDYATGAVYYKQAISIYEKSPYPETKEKGDLLLNLGQLYYKYNTYPLATNLSKAVFYHKKAFNFYRKISYYKGLGTSLLFLAVDFDKWGITDSSKYYFKLAQPYFLNQLSSNPQLMSQYYFKLGFPYLKTAPLEAVKYFKMQYEEEMKYGAFFSLNKEIVLRNIGYAYLHANEYQKALDNFYQGCGLLNADPKLLRKFQLPPMNEIASVNELSLMIENIANVYKLWSYAKPDSIELWENSLKSHLLSLDMLDSLKSRIHEEEIRNYLPDYYFHLYPNGMEAAEYLFQHTKNPKYIEAAWKIIEKGKGTLLVTGMRNSDKSLEDSRIYQEMDYRKKISDLKREIKYFEQKKRLRKVKELSKELIQLKELQEAFFVETSQEFPGYLSHFFDPSTVSLSDFQKKHISEDEVFINYLVGGYNLYAITVTKDSIYFSNDSISIERIRQVNTLHHFFRTKPILRPVELDIDSFVWASNGVFKLVTGQKKSLIKNKSLILSPASGLSRIPFEALITNDDLPIDSLNYRSLPYLFKENDIRYSFSASTLAYTLENQISKPSGKVMGMAPIEFQSGSQLLSSKDEIEKISQFYPVDKCFLEQATKKIFQKKYVDYSILHLATHGIADTSFSQLARLLFYADKTKAIKEDEPLYLTEIYAMPMKAELVVLSACETAEGKRQIGEGVISLGRGFRSAGAKSILMSMWKIDDQVANDIMSEFYKNLSKEVPKHIAIQAAKRRFLNRTDKEKTDPYYWAHLVFYGNPQKIVPPFWFGKTWILYVLLSFMVLGIVGWLARQRSIPKN